MALKNVRPSASGSRHRGRWVTRAEAKAGATQARRVKDRQIALSAAEIICARAGYCVRTLGADRCSLCGGSL